MIKKVMAAAALAVSAVGGTAAPAMAAGGGGDSKDLYNANGATQMYGNTWTGGYMSPQMGLINGSFNKPCIAIGKLGIQGLLGAVPISLQDIPILSSQQQQQCTENSVINDGDDPLSHILDDVAILSGNGSGNAGGLFGRLGGHGKHRRH
ncbi:MULTISPECIES: rodlin [Streptomyces]|uniref:RdlA protein n=1 Tax=Streptomyces griseocarneus TaxID=51201 RepID=A0ABX7RUZ3_9ACTN|nr:MULTISPECIES: rodlin [Streptomyces]QSY52116.1 RdlA protein [Streptomyces griseocarneus]